MSEYHEREKLKCVREIERDKLHTLYWESRNIWENYSWTREGNECPMSYYYKEKVSENMKQKTGIL